MKEIDVGQLIGHKYVLLRLLGAGAMGQVWVGRHQALHQPFAVKLMVPPEASGTQAFEGLETSLRRFENEAQIAAALSRKSRHIAQVIDYGIDEEVAYLVMELLEGEGLDRRIGGGRTLDLAEVSAVVSQIAKGLTVAHAEGVRHRDLKPANVFLTKTEDGELLVKLLDFGIAQMARRLVKPKDGTNRAPTRLTIKGLVLGSPAYMSPEQAMDESPDERADVWSLAVLAYEAIAGIAPFHAKTADATIVRICNFQSTPLRKLLPDASPELEALFARAFAPKIEERFRTPNDFADALAALLPAPAKSLSAPDAARPPAAVPEPEGGVSLRVPLRPRKLVPAIAAGAVVGLVIAGALLGPRLFGNRAPETPKAAAQESAPKASTAEAPKPLPSIEPSPSAPVLDVQQLPRVKPPARHSATTPVTSTPATAQPANSVDRSAVF